MIGNDIVKDAFKEEVTKDDTVPFFEGYVKYKDMILEIFVKSSAIEEALRKLSSYPNSLDKDPSENEENFRIGADNTAWEGKYGYILNNDFVRKTQEGYNQNWGSSIHYSNNYINLNILNVVGLSKGVTFREGTLLKPSEVACIKDSLSVNVKNIHDSYMKSCYHKLVLMRTDLVS